MSEKVTIVMKAEDVPEGATVTKKTGSKKYKVLRKIELHGQGCIEAQEGTVILTSSNDMETGKFYPIKSETMVCCTMDAKDAVKYIQKNLIYYSHN